MSTAQEILELLDQNKNKPFVREILNAFENEEMAFSGRTELQRLHTINVYKNRKGIQETVTKSETVLGYSDLISVLERNTSELVFIVMVYTKTNSYLIFYKDNALFGILKTTNSNLTRHKALHKDYLDRGATSQSYVYLRGKLMYAHPSS